MAVAFSGAGQLAVAAAGRGQIQHQRTRPHFFYHGGADDARGGPPRHLGRGNQNAGAGHVLRQQFALRPALFRRQFAGVAALRLGLDVGREEAPAQRFHLLPRRRAYVRHLHHRPQAARRGDGLQAGHPGAQHQHRRRAHGAGGPGEHGEKAAVGGGRRHHGAVAGHGTLGRQGIHGLGPRAARHRLHGEGAQAALGQAGQRLLAAVRVQEAGQRAALRLQAQIFRRRRRHPQHQVRALIYPVFFDHRRPGLAVILVRVFRAGAGIGLHPQLQALRAQALHYFRHQGYAPLRAGFLARDGNSHG